MPRSRILGSYTASSSWISHQNYFCIALNIWRFDIGRFLTDLDVELSPLIIWPPGADGHLQWSVQFLTSWTEQNRWPVRMMCYFPLWIGPAGKLYALVLQWLGPLLFDNVTVFSLYRIMIIKHFGSLRKSQNIARNAWFVNDTRMESIFNTGIRSNVDFKLYFPDLLHNI